MSSKSWRVVPSTSRFGFASAVVGRLDDFAVVIVDVAPETAHSASAVAARPVKSQEAIHLGCVLEGLRTGSFRSVLANLAHKLGYGRPIPLAARLIELLEVA